jgi:hypothetical protein
MNKPNQFVMNSSIESITSAQYTDEYSEMEECTTVAGYRCQCTACKDLPAGTVLINFIITFIELLKGYHEFAPDSKNLNPPSFLSCIPFFDRLRYDFMTLDDWKAIVLSHVSNKELYIDWKLIRDFFIKMFGGFPDWKKIKDNKISLPIRPLQKSILGQACATLLTLSIELDSNYSNHDEFYWSSRNGWTRNIFHARNISIVIEYVDALGTTISHKIEIPHLQKQNSYIEATEHLTTYLLELFRYNTNESTKV